MGNRDNVRDKHLARLNLDIAIREWARLDERARAVVMQHDMRRLNNGTAMLLEEFPKAAHPQVFAILLLWMVTGRHLIFVDPKQKELNDSWDLAMEAFVRMYKESAGRFKVPGAPSWKGKFTPLELSQEGPSKKAGKRRRR